MELKLFITTFIVVAAILASPKHKAFTWSYRSSIYRIHWYIYTAKNAQVVTSLLTSCNNLLQQARYQVRSRGLRQLVTTSLLQVVNRAVTKALIGKVHIDIFAFCPTNFFWNQL